MIYSTLVGLILHTVIAGIAILFMYYIIFQYNKKKMEEFRKQNILNENNITEKINTMAVSIADSNFKMMEEEIKKHVESHIDLILSSASPPLSSHSRSSASWAPQSSHISAISKSWSMRWQQWAESIQQQQQQQLQQQQQFSEKFDKLKENQKLTINQDTFKMLDDRVERQMSALENKLTKDCQDCIKLIEGTRKSLELQTKKNPKLEADLASIRNNIRDLGTRITNSEKRLSDNNMMITNRITAIDTDFKKQIEKQQGHIENVNKTGSEQINKSIKESIAQQMSSIKETTAQQISSIKESTAQQISSIKESTAQQINSIKEIAKTCNEVQHHVDQFDEQIGTINQNIKDNSGEILDIGRQIDAVMNFKGNLNIEIKDQKKQVGVQKQDFQNQRKYLDQSLAQVKDALTTQIHNESNDVVQHLSDQINADKDDLRREIKETDDDLNQLENQMQELNKNINNQIRDLEKNIHKIRNTDLVTLANVVKMLVQNCEVLTRRSGKSNNLFQTPQTAMTPQSERSTVNQIENTSQELVARCFELLGNLSPQKESLSQKSFGRN